jgi:hypothetical protein
MRADIAEDVLWKSVSHDDGRTWDGPVPTDLHGECACVVTLRDGLVMAAYRSSENAPDSAPIGLLVSLSSDSGRTWSDEVALPDPKGRRYEASHETGMPDIVEFPDGRVVIVYYSFDPNLPWAPPPHDPVWDSVAHFFKRYIAATVLERR